MITVKLYMTDGDILTCKVKDMQAVSQLEDHVVGLVKIVVEDDNETRS